jgi:hypothetical protein
MLTYFDNENSVQMHKEIFPLYHGFTVCNKLPSERRHTRQRCCLVCSAGTGEDIHNVAVLCYG